MASTVKKRLTPTGNVRIIMYDVGFGDCFLLSFEYHGTPQPVFRHVLIDCGTSTEKAPHMDRVVQRVTKDCGGRLHGLVVTHRHLDHLSAFGLKTVGQALEALRPDVVVQPWTEDRKKVEQAPKTAKARQVRTHLLGLTAAQGVADYLASHPQALRGRGLKSAAPFDTAFIASLNIRNKEAVKRLATIGKRRAYVHYGSKSGLESVLPGVRITVLGPPSLAQCSAITTQTRSDPVEFWKLRRQGLQLLCADEAVPDRSARLFPAAETTALGRCASPVRWVIDRLNRANLDEMNRLMEGLDAWVNNTSVVLLFEVRGKALLFPGDAQLESWQYALHDPKVAKRVRKAVVYKVGHHGSTNATPKSRLWEQFEHRGTNGRRGDLRALLSTKAGKHHRVPRTSLVDTMKKEAHVIATNEGGRGRPPSRTWNV